MSPARYLQSQRGTSTLEFVIVLPTLLFVLFGVAEIARLWYTVNIATTAAREGARVGAVTSSPSNVFNETPAHTKIDQILTASNLLAGTTRAVECPTPCGPDSSVQASVTVTFQTAIPLLKVVPLLAGPLSITQTAVMRHE